MMSAFGSKCEELNLSKSCPPCLNADLVERCCHFAEGPQADSLAV